MSHAESYTPAASVSLVVPDPRRAPIPSGWATEIFAAVADEMEWDDLDERESELRALASYIESMEADSVELQKALRIIEFRRGVLLDPDVRKGERPNLSMRGKVEEVPPATASRFRDIARHWDRIVWPHILTANDIRDVSQAAILRLIQEVKRKDVSTSRPEAVAADDALPFPEVPVEPEAPLATTYVPEEHGEFEEPEVDPIAEWERAEKELEEERRVNAALQKDDHAKEVARLALHVNSLEGRIRELQTSKKELHDTAQYQGRIIQQLRKLLKVDSPSAIVPAVQELLP